MKVWAVANQKGGVGKTTTAVTLAGILAEEGLRVLAMDLAQIVRCSIVIKQWSKLWHGKVSVNRGGRR